MTVGICPDHIRLYIKILGLLILLWYNFNKQKAYRKPLNRNDGDWSNINTTCSITIFFSIFSKIETFVSNGVSHEYVIIIIILHFYFFDYDKACFWLGVIVKNIAINSFFFIIKFKSHKYFLTQ